MREKNASQRVRMLLALNFFDNAFVASSQILVYNFVGYIWELYILVVSAFQHDFLNVADIDEVRTIFEFNDRFTCCSTK